MKLENETRISRRSFLAVTGGRVAYALTEPGSALAQASPEPTPAAEIDDKNSPWPRIMGTFVGITSLIVISIATLTWAAKRGAERT